MKNHTRYLTTAGVIAAIYITLCLVLRPISFSIIQIRIAEALCILPYFTPAAVPGLSVGCLLANILGGGDITDIAFGSLATLIGAAGSRLIRRHKYLVALPPIISNTLILPLVFRFAYGDSSPWWFLAGNIAAGELVSAGILGTLLLIMLEKYRVFKQ